MRFDLTCLTRMLAAAMLARCASARAVAEADGPNAAMLTGQRLGDLRRDAKAGTDPFPTGTHPAFPESNGTMHCVIVPRSEKSGKPPD